MILRTQFKGIWAFCKRKRPVVHRTPSQAYTSTQTNLGVGQPFFDPQKRPLNGLLLQCSLGIDVIENVDYMIWVNKTNWQNIFLRVQP